MHKFITYSNEKRLLESTMEASSCLKEKDIFVTTIILVCTSI